MKNKIRKITVNGIEFCWQRSKKDSYYKYDKLKIWHKKKLVYENVNYFKSETTTPKFVARFIKTFILKKISE
jgi:hypothetical protein